MRKIQEIKCWAQNSCFGYGMVIFMFRGQILHCQMLTVNGKKRRMWWNVPFETLPTKCVNFINSDYSIISITNIFKLFYKSIFFSRSSIPWSINTMRVFMRFHQIIKMQLFRLLCFECVIVILEQRKHAKKIRSEWPTIYTQLCVCVCVCLLLLKTMWMDFVCDIQLQLKWKYDLWHLYINIIYYAKREYNHNNNFIYYLFTIWIYNKIQMESTLFRCDVQFLL